MASPQVPSLHKSCLGRGRVPGKQPPPWRTARVLRSAGLGLETNILHVRAPRRGWGPWASDPALIPTPFWLVSPKALQSLVSQPTLSHPPPHIAAKGFFQITYLSVGQFTLLTGSPLPIGKCPNLLLQCTSPAPQPQSYPLGLLSEFHLTPALVILPLVVSNLRLTSPIHP